MKQAVRSPVTLLLLFLLLLLDTNNGFCLASTTTTTTRSLATKTSSSSVASTTSSPRWGFRRSFKKDTTSLQQASLAIDHDETTGTATNVLTIPEEEVEDDSGPTTYLSFGGTFSHAVDPVPSSTLDEVQEFLHIDRPHHVGLLLKGGDFPVERVPSTPELIQRWKHRAAKHGWEVDDEDQEQNEIYRVRNVIHLLPGLNLHAESIMGCRRRIISKSMTNSNHQVMMNPFMARQEQHQQKQQHTPCVYEFTLIHDDVVAQGSRFLVWLYGQVSGEGRKTTTSATVFDVDEQNVGRRTFSYMKVQVGPDAGLTIDGSIRTVCKIPRRVLSFLPVSKAKAEDKVSRAIASELAEETMRSAEKFRTAFEEWRKK